MKQSQQGISFIGLLIIIISVGVLMLYFSSSTTKQMIQEVKVNVMEKTFGKSNEEITKRCIGFLRQGISKYKADNNIYPITLSSFGDPPFIPSYLREIPPAILGINVPEEKRSSNHVSYGVTVTNEGGWLYDPQSGKITVNFDGLDNNGVNYTGY